MDESIEGGEAQTFTSESGHYGGRAGSGAAPCDGRGHLRAKSCSSLT
jgi:hypothetical protein